MNGETHQLDDVTALVGIAQRAPLSDEARAVLDENETPRQFLDRLTAAEHWPDATWVLAHAMPKREVVWWACRCARMTAEADPPAPFLEALDAAERWVIDPSEPNRRAAQAASEAAGLDNPAGCSALAAFFSGGSIAPPDVPAVPPGPHLSAHTAAGAVMLAAVRSEPEKAPSKYQQFLDLGLSVAQGSERWPEAAAAPSVATRPAPAPARTWDETHATPTPPTTTEPTSPSPSPRKRWDEWE